jgi:signal transduction histidine kinase
MGTINILVIDDEAGICQSIERTLKDFSFNLGYLDEVYHAHVESRQSAEEGLERLKKGDIQIVLLDNQLPGMNGTELMVHLEELGLTEDLVIIMITAYASIETAVTATRHGAYDFVTKPFTPKEIRDALFKASKYQVLASTAKKLTADKKKVRFEFISMLSHELKSPIAAVSNYLSLLERQIYGNDLGAYNQFILRSQVRLRDMEKLIFDLLDLTRIESGEKQRDLQPTEMESLVIKALEDHAAEIQTRGVIVHQQTEPVHLIADKTELLIVINNLVTNAIKYNRDEGEIDISLTRKKDKVIFSVKDTGIGMTESEQKQLFKEFSRIRNEKTATISGSGIGLSTVRKIVSLYNGIIDVQSTPDHGTTFTIELTDKE